MNKNGDPPRTEFTVSFATLCKVLAAVLLGYIAVWLWPFSKLLLLALLVALTLRPVRAWTERRGWPSWSSVLIATVLTFGSVLLLLLILIPALASQGNALLNNLPELQAKALAQLPEKGPLREAANQYLNTASSPAAQPVMGHVWTLGSSAVSAFAEFLVVLVIAIYFFADGRRVYEWLLAFLPEVHRRKVATAAPEITTVVSSYMFGQLITSVLCSAYVFGLLMFLHVPSAALLAVLAGIFDVLPMIGFFLSIIPAALLALTVSPLATVLVLVFYGAYHLFETYFIVPKIYGNRLRLSTLTVLVSCIAAGVVAGVVGAIVILPIIASYPIIERLWLRPFLERDTVEKHEEIVAREHPEK